jgi:riboflavin synthase
MFTGLVQAVGRLQAQHAHGNGFKLSLQAPWADLQIGESICVDGVCLTVVEPDAHSFRADISSETAARTTLGSLKPGAEVNLERALRPMDRLGGHWVTGHVDQVVQVVALNDANPGKSLRIELDPPLIYLVASKGSVCLNGVSLTVNSVTRTSFDVMLIPQTLEVTNLKYLSVGAQINCEVDLMARYAARLLEAKLADNETA